MVVEVEFGKLLLVDTLQLKCLFLGELEQVLENLFEALEAEVEAEEAVEVHALGGVCDFP